jgi:hypothetical protein
LMADYRAGAIRSGASFFGRVDSRADRIALQRFDQRGTEQIPRIVRYSLGSNITGILEGQLALASATRNGR